MVTLREMAGAPGVGGWASIYVNIYQTVKPIEVNNLALVTWNINGVIFMNLIDFDPFVNGQIASICIRDHVILVLSMNLCLIYFMQ